MGDLTGARTRRRAPLPAPVARRGAGGRALAGLLAASAVALGGCAGSTHRLDHAAEARLLSEIASARQAAGAHNRAAARSALDRFLETVAKLRRQGALTAGQARGLESQADGALHVAMVLLAPRVTTTAAQDSASDVSTASQSAQSTSSASSHPASPQGATAPSSPGPPGQSGGPGQGPPQANGPHGGPGQGHAPPGQARKHQDDGNDNQGGDGGNG